MAWCGVLDVSSTQGRDNVQELRVVLVRGIEGGENEHGAEQLARCGDEGDVLVLLCLLCQLPVLDHEESN